MNEILDVTAEEDEFWEVLTRFQEKLLSEQQPFSADEAKLLSENLWDLYAD